MRLFHFFDRIVTSRITLGLVLFAALALLIWYGGPKLAIDGTEPLASQTSRLIAIAVLAVVFLCLEALRRWRIARLNRRILASLGSIDGASAPGDGVGRVREGYAMLCETLRMHGGRRLRDRRHLYDQPWYLVLGEPGSGRTAALANSGLEFVLDSGSLKRSAGSVPGRGGECGWWVTDDAVFVVAPGGLRDRARSHPGRRVGRPAGLPEVGAPTPSAERHHTDRPRELPAVRTDRARGRPRRCAGACRRP